MAKVRERTEDFKDAARRAALNLGYNDVLLVSLDFSKTAAIMASFIMRKNRELSSFTKAALTTIQSIGALEQFIMKHKKDYVDLHRTTEQERDSIEHEVTVFIKACKDQIDVLKNSINAEEATSKGWLGIRSVSLNADTVAHKHGVVLILSEKLHSVTSQFDQLRALRFQDAINRVMPRRKLKRSGTSDVAESSTWRTIELKEIKNSEFRPMDDVQAEPIRFQQQLLDDETRALQVELASMLDAVQETETKMVEMSALNHLMSTHVLQQAQQIEYLYEQAVEATKNVELGNKELSQAIQRNSRMSYIIRSMREMMREKEEEAEQMLTMANAVQQYRQLHNESSASQHGGSTLNHRVINQNREEGHARLYRDYFSDTPTYPETMFRRRFRMRRPLFLRIEGAITAAEDVLMAQMKRTREARMPHGNNNDAIFILSTM
ncbi:Syntaxin-81 [Orobanche hederae]